MAEITDLSEYVNILSGGNSGNPQHLFLWKDGRIAGAAATAPIAGRPLSLWLYDGQPSGGAVPGAVAIPDNTTIGGLRQTDPSGGRQLWLCNLGMSSLVAGSFFAYDRLLHIGGFSGTNTGAQAVGGAITRYTNGIGNRIVIEIYTAIGASSTTITAAYTNQDGNPATTQPTAIGNTNFREATRMIFLPLALGDRGVQGVTSVTLAATTGTAGNFGVTLMHPLARSQSVITGAGGIASLLLKGSGPVEILTDACVALYLNPFAAALLPQLFPDFQLVEH